MRCWEEGRRRGERVERGLFLGGRVGWSRRGLFLGRREGEEERVRGGRRERRVQGGLFLWFREEGRGERRRGCFGRVGEGRGLGGVVLEVFFFLGEREREMVREVGKVVLRG